MRNVQAFPMRAGLPNKEPNWQKDWADATLYEKRQELNEGKPSFMLHDGPVSLALNATKIDAERTS